MQNTIFLIGYMGCGKTTLGRALAERADVTFIDLDDYVEARAGMSISRIFADRGEAAFRAMEREALTEIAASRADGTTVVACGGGTPCFCDNMRYMLGAGTTVWLDATVGAICRRLLVTSVDRLFGRLAVARAHRPLIASLSDDELRNFIVRQLDIRTPHYTRAKAEFDSTLLEDPDQIEQTARRFIDRFGLR